MHFFRQPRNFCAKIYSGRHDVRPITNNHPSSALMNQNIEEQILAAIENNDSDSFISLLPQLPDTSIDMDDWSELMCAAIEAEEMERLDMLCTLSKEEKLKRPMRYNLYCSDQIDVCVMHAAAESASVDIMKRVLECDVDIDAHDESGITALGIATECGYDDVAKLLLSKGADPDMANPDMDDEEWCEEEEC